MRLSKINTWSGAYTPPRKVEDTDEVRAKPPDADTGVSGVQIQPVASGGDQRPDEPTSHALDITI